MPISAWVVDAETVILLKAAPRMRQLLERYQEALRHERTLPDELLILLWETAVLLEGLEDDYVFGEPNG